MHCVPEMRDFVLALPIAEQNLLEYILFWITFQFRGTLKEIPRNKYQITEIIQQLVVLCTTNFKK